MSTYEPAPERERPEPAPEPEPGQPDTMPEEDPGMTPPEPETLPEEPDVILNARGSRTTRPQTRRRFQGTLAALAGPGSRSRPLVSAMPASSEER
jgi:hypothetical protein